MLLEGSVRVEHGSHVHEIPLDDPARPGFLRLPSIDLDDGRPLRRAAFDVWAAHVRAALAVGREFETTYRPPKPLATALTMTGAGVMSILCVLLLWTWAFRPDPAVDVRPTTLGSVAILVSVAAILAIVFLCTAAFVRAWRCRSGSYAALGSRGLRTVSGGRSEPFADLAAAQYHPWLRCTRVVFGYSRPDLWIPVEPGALRRLDLLLAAVDERLGAALRASI